MSPHTQIPLLSLLPARTPLFEAAAPFPPLLRTRCSPGCPSCRSVPI